MWVNIFRCEGLVKRCERERGSDGEEVGQEHSSTRRSAFRPTLFRRIGTHPVGLKPDPPGVALVGLKPDPQLIP